MLTTVINYYNYGNNCLSVAIFLETEWAEVRECVAGFEVNWRFRQAPGTL